MSDTGSCDDCKIENRFEVTDCENGSAAVSAGFYLRNLGYRDTWEGNTIKARQSYYGDDNNEHICDVRPELARAEELAVTKRQKLHSEIAGAVMRRILDTDAVFNPDYTEKGQWNFFEYNETEARDGRIHFTDNRKYSFEWKEVGRRDRDGFRVLYNFLYDILDDAAGCVWSDEWVPGYEFKDKELYLQGEHTKVSFSVLEDETVTVPAGTFAGCRHIAFEHTGMSDSWVYRGGQFDYWFAPGVGIVKMTRPIFEKDDNIWELTAFRGTGEGYFPIDDGLFRRYEPIILGGGWHGSVEYTFDTDETGTVMFRNALGTQDRANNEADLAAKAAKEAESGK